MGTRWSLIEGSVTSPLTFSFFYFFDSGNPVSLSLQFILLSYSQATSHALQVL